MCVVCVCVHTQVWRSGPFAGPRGDLCYISKSEISIVWAGGWTQAQNVQSLRKPEALLYRWGNVLRATSRAFYTTDHLHMLFLL